MTENYSDSLNRWLVLFEEKTRDNLSLDLRGALVNLKKLGITKELCVILCTFIGKDLEYIMSSKSFSH